MSLSKLGVALTIGRIAVNRRIAFNGEKTEQAPSTARWVATTDFIVFTGFTVDIVTLLE